MGCARHARDALPDRVGDQDLHRHRIDAAGRGRQAAPRRHAGPLLPRCARRLARDHDPPARQPQLRPARAVGRACGQCGGNRRRRAEGAARLCARHRDPLWLHRFRRAARGDGEGGGQGHRRDLPRRDLRAARPDGHRLQRRAPMGAVPLGAAPGAARDRPCLEGWRAADQRLPLWRDRLCGGRSVQLGARPGGAVRRTRSGRTAQAREPGAAPDAAPAQDRQAGRLRRGVDRRHLAWRQGGGA